MRRVWLHDEEVWRPVPGYRGYYEASSFGRVRSVPRTFRDSLGRPRQFAGRILNPTITDTGYPVVGLCRCGKERQYAVHVVVLLAFEGPPPEGKPYGLHNNDVKTNCRIENLRWGTPAENQQDIEKNNSNFKRRKNLPDPKLTPKDVRTIKQNIKDGCVQSQLARQFGVSPATICDIKKGRQWSHIR